jgi:AGZA family xanthine/uracil permease-like MFS transporter
VGIGLFLSFIGLNQTGIVALGVVGAPVKTGALTSAPVLVAVFGFLLTSVLVIRKFPGALLVGIVVTALVAFFAKVAPWPSHVLSMPPSVMPIVMQVDLRGALSWKAFPVVLTIFIMAFVDTMGTLIGLSARAGFLDKEGNLPQIERPMLVDAVATTVAPILGTTTSGAFVESATGIEAGGRTGLVSLVVAMCFAAALFFAPFVAAIPPQAYGPTLILVGLFMLAPITKINFEDYTESIPSFAVVALMCFTFNIAVGMSAGFVLYAFSKVASGRVREIKPGMWVLTGFSMLFFGFYPYH